MLHGIEVPSNVRHGNTLARPLRDYGPKDHVDVIVTNPPFGGMEEDGIENNFPAEFRTRETADLFLVLLMELLKDGGRAGHRPARRHAVRRRHQDPHQAQAARGVQPPHHRPPAQGRLRSVHDDQDQPPVLHQGRAHQGRLVLRAPLPAMATRATRRPSRCGSRSSSPRRHGGTKREETERAWKVTREDIAAGGYNLDIANPNVVDDGHEDPDVLLVRLAGATARRRGRPRCASHQHCRGPCPRLMNTTRFLDNFATIVETLDGIQRLRDLMRDLAVCGRLVPQNDGDGPAHLVSIDLPVQRRRDPSAIEATESPAAQVVLPPSWQHVRAAQLGQLIRGVTYSKSDVRDTASDVTVPLLRAHNIDGSINYENLVHVGATVVSDAQFLRSGDHLICMSSGSARLVGKSAMVTRDDRVGFGAFCSVFRPTTRSMSPYLDVFLQSPLYRRQISLMSRGIGINNIGSGALQQLDNSSSAAFGADADRSEG